MGRNSIYHEILLGDSVIKRKGEDLAGTYLTSLEMKNRIPRRDQKYDLLVSSRGDLTGLFWLEAEVNLEGPVNAARFRVLVTELLSTLPPGAMIMKQDWILDADASGKPFRRTLVGITLTRAPRTSNGILDFGFFSRYVWLDEPDVDFQRLAEHYVQCLCNRIDSSRLCRTVRIRGEELDGVIDWFLTLNGEANYNGLSVGDLPSLGDRFLKMIGIMEDGEVPIWSGVNLVDTMVVKKPDVSEDKLPLLKRIPTCNMIFTQFFASEGKTVHDPIWRALKGGPVNRPVLETDFNVITWAVTEAKLNKNFDMIDRRLERQGAFTRWHGWSEPWYLIASIPGLAGELPTDYSYLAYPEAAAQYVMPPVKPR